MRYVLKVTFESGGSIMSLRRCAWLVLAVTASACATSVETPLGEEFEPQAGAERGNSRLIVRAELDDLSGRSAYEAIERLHPRWLRPGRASTISSGAV